MKKAFGIFMALYIAMFAIGRPWTADIGYDPACKDATEDVMRGKACEHWSVAKQFIPDAMFHNLQESFGPSWKEGKKDIHVSHVFFAILTFALGIMLALAARRKVRDPDNTLPERRMSAFTFFDVLMESMLKLMESMMPRKYALQALPIVTAFAVFILIANVMGLVPWLLTPAESLNTTLALATCSLVTYMYFSFKVQGVGGTFKHLMGPIPALSPLMFPIEALGFFLIRPGSLALRLLGNMFGDHQVLVAFLGFHLVFVPLPVMVLGLVVCIVQTVVFCMLTMVYIAMAVEEHDHGHGDHGHGEAHAH